MIVLVVCGVLMLDILLLSLGIMIVLFCVIDILISTSDNSALHDHL